MKHRKKYLASHQSDTALRKSKQLVNKWRKYISQKQSAIAKHNLMPLRERHLQFIEPDASGPQQLDKSQESRKMTACGNHGLLTFEDAREGCINPIIERSKQVHEAMPSQEEVRFCVVTGKGHAEDCVSRT
jgi:hypothetical protein